MRREQISIETKDGVCPTSVFTPEGKGAGPWPAVIYIVDGLAIRPSVFDMGQRLADTGYVVFVPDTFYRFGPYEPRDPKVVLAQPDVRKALGAMIGSTDNRRAAEDAGYVLAQIDARSDVAGKKVGVVGYCMGGGIALTIAATYPDRIAAAASFHGGALASDSELSPHLLAPKMKGRVYIGVADKDNSYPPEMGERLERALREAGVEFVAAFYPGALHGWTQIDFPVYDKAAEERHWRDLIDLYDATLH
jgi:carboxymethylenebutenolidase